LIAFVDDDESVGKAIKEMLMAMTLPVSLNVSEVDLNIVCIISIFTGYASRESAKALKIAIVEAYDARRTLT
jgi:hypothetical protein